MTEKKRTFKKVVAGTGIVGLVLAGKMVIDYKKEETDQSFKSWLLERVFGLFSTPLKQIESKTLYEKGIQRIGAKTEKHVAIPQLDAIEGVEVYINNMQNLVFNDKKDKNQQVIFFLHGGAYIFQPASPHFNTVEEMIKQTDAKVVMPIYPKAPAYTYKEAYPKVMDAYREAAAKTSTPKNITLMGDSAGGGLALGLSSLLAKEELPQPNQLILISPWLDASSENPKMKNFEETDTLLPTQPYFQATGRLWAGGEEDVYHPLVSPLYTTQLEYLPPTAIFAGGDEMLYPDVLKFQSYMEEAGREVQLYVKEHMVHDYVIFDTPEGQEAKEIISDLILAQA